MPLKHEINDTIIRVENNRQWEALKKKYGSIGFGGPLPQEERWRASKVIHALYVLSYWDGRGSAKALLSNYGIPGDVCDEVIEKFCTEDEAVEAPDKPKKKIADRYRALDTWAFEHPLEQITPDVMSEISGLSYASVMKYVKTSPRYKKIKNGLYEAVEEQQRVF